MSLTIDNASQIGIINSCNTHNGFYLQLGVWNVSEDRSTVLINFGYKSKELSDTVTDNWFFNFLFGFLSEIANSETKTNTFLYFFNFYEFGAFELLIQ